MRETGRLAPDPRPLRYVILAHDHPHPHWDFMLEAGGVLRTWRLDREPAAGAQVPAAASFDHRLAYLEYEGPVSGGRGVVTRWDEGTYDLAQERDGVMITVLAGRRLSGRADLTRGAGDRWLFVYHPHPPGT